MLNLGFVKKGSIQYLILLITNQLSQILFHLSLLQIISLSSFIKYWRFGLILLSFFKWSVDLHFSVQMSCAYME